MLAPIRVPVNTGMTTDLDSNRSAHFSTIAGVLPQPRQVRHRAVRIPRHARHPADATLALSGRYAPATHYAHTAPGGPARHASAAQCKQLDLPYCQEEDQLFEREPTGFGLAKSKPA